MKDFSQFLTESFMDKFKKEKGITKTVGSTGYSEKEEKWYGWSHRAVFGFKVGDMIFEPDFGDDNTHFAKHGSKPCKTMDDCQKSAKAFSDYVS